MSHARTLCLPSRLNKLWWTIVLGSWDYAEELMFRMVQTVDACAKDPSEYEKNLRRKNVKTQYVLEMIDDTDSTSLSKDSSSSYRLIHSNRTIVIYYLLPVSVAVVLLLLSGSFLLFLWLLGIIQLPLFSYLQN